MPIAFANLRFLNVRPQDGACAALAYIGRQAISDRHLRRRFDFTRAAGDLVLLKMLLPAGAHITTVEEFANGLDGAERRRMRRLLGRQRWPQFGAHAIFALPSDAVLTLDEAAGLAEWIVRYVVGGSKIPVVYAIHDPALEEPGAETRHGHVVFASREFDGAGFSQKVRGLFAAVRHGGGGNTTPQFVAEGQQWPDLMRDAQTLLFAEIGSDVVVDPPAPVGGRHWSKKALAREPERRRRHDASVASQNLAVIEGPPATLADSLLRGRGLMRIDELKRLLGRFIDGDDEREARLHAILADPAIVTLAVTDEDARPRWITTRAVHEAMLAARRRVDRAVRPGNPPSAAGTLSAVIGGSHEAVSALLDAQLAGYSKIHRPLVLGVNSSDWSSIGTSLDGAVTQFGTFDAFLRPRPRTSRRSRTAPRVGIRRRGLVIVPCAERVPDQDLAALLLRARKVGARILLGFNLVKAVPSCAFAARLVDRVAENEAIPDENIATYLRAGLVRRACTALLRGGSVRFGTSQQPEAPADFFVYDDLKRAASLSRDAPDDRLAMDVALSETARDAPTLPNRQWIVYTGSDYKTDHIRAGRFGKVFGLLPDGAMEVLNTDGSRCTLSQDSRHFRAAETISIREARGAPQSAALAINNTEARRAWSAAVLAADRIRTATLSIDPSVASGLNQWIAAVQRASPWPVPAELVPMADPDAQLVWLMKAIYLGRAPTIVPALPRSAHTHRQGERDLPSHTELVSTRRTSNEQDAETVASAATQAGGALSQVYRPSLHEDLRSAICSDADSRLGFERLRAALTSPDHDRQTIGRELLRSCSDESALAALIKLLLSETEVGHGKENELEVIGELAERLPKKWSHWELYCLRLDLRSMSLRQSNWPMPLGPLGAQFSLRDSSRSTHAVRTQSSAFRGNP